MTMLKLRPSYKDYLWGGKKLVSDFNKEYNGDILAESWELSCHPEGPSYIANGEYEGETLKEYILMEGKKILGKHARKFKNFPVLVKLIDAAQDLSIQVHPNDAFAMENEKQYGKMEMWYIIDCDKDASLYYGFSKAIDKEELEMRIKDNTLPEVLNKVYVKKGDVLFIDPGTIHAIGKGCVIAEIQQSSNVTYRVYDYGRKDKNGKERDLHIEKALQVTKRVPILHPKSFEPHIAECEYFTVDKLFLDGRIMKSMSGTIDQTTFVSVLVLEGVGTIHSAGEKLGIQKGDSIFLTADTGNYEIEGKCEMLLITI